MPSPKPLLLAGTVELVELRGGGHAGTSSVNEAHECVSNKNPNAASRKLRRSTVREDAVWLSPPYLQIVVTQRAAGLETSLHVAGCGRLAPHLQSEHERDVSSLNFMKRKANAIFLLSTCSHRTSPGPKYKQAEKHGGKDSKLHFD